MRLSPAVVALAASAAGIACGDTAVVVTVAGDLANAERLDTICLSVHDDDPSGGEFTQVYRLDELADVDELTLTVEPGVAERGTASVRGYRRGVEVARDRRAFTFGGGVNDLALFLDACPEVDGGAAALMADVAGAPGVRVAVSFGRGSSVIVVAGPGTAVAYLAGASTLDVAGAQLPPAPSQLDELIAFDADGDCDDDLLLVGTPELALWRRTGTGAFEEAPGAFGGVAAASAAAVADVDSDGDLDVVAGTANSLTLYRNDGTGEFAADGAAIPGGFVTDVTAVAAGDLDGDGHVDLVVGQGSAGTAFARVLLNDASGEGRFVAAPAALPEVPLQVTDVAIADANGDGFGDAFVSVAAGSLRVYVNRGDGRLEDRSFVTLPDQPSDVSSIAAAEWDGDCLVDVVLGFAAGDPVAWRGSDTGVFELDALPDVSSNRVVLADVDDDGDFDLVLAGDDAISWVSR